MVVWRHTRAIVRAIAAPAGVGLCAVLLLVALPAHAKDTQEPPPAPSPDEGATHVVRPGQSLWTISRLHGCSLQALKNANDLDGNLIRDGQKLVVPRCDRALEPPRAPDAKDAGADGTAKRDPPAAESAAPPGPGIVHQVSPGDTLFKLALQYDTSVQDIAIRNELIGRFIRPGQKLRIVPGNRTRGEVLVGQSMGTPQAGKLVHALKLTTVRGMYVRRPARAYGANHVIYHVRRVVRTVMRHYPQLHDLAIGDLSSQYGGDISGHGSHESGRDVDLGFYFRKPPKNYPEEFATGTAKTLHLPAMWTLLSTLAATTSSPSGVERIFLDYDIQGIMYRWCKDQGVPQRTLDFVFQYPHGRSSHAGLVHHEPSHEDHFHVRFKCPEGDQICR